MTSEQRTLRLFEIDVRIGNLEEDMQEMWGNGEPTQHISTEIAQLREARVTLMNTFPTPDDANEV